MSEEDATRSPQGGEPTRAFPPHSSENTTPASPSADYPTQAYAANPGTYPGPGLYGAGQGNQHGSAGYPGAQAGPGSQYPGQAGYPQQGNYPGQAPQYGSGQAGQYGGPGYPGGQYGPGQGGQYGAPGYPSGPGNQYPGGGPNGPNGPRGAYPAGYGQQPQQPKQSKTGLFVGIGVGIVALIALVVGLIFFLNRDKASDDAQPDPSSVPSISAPATPDGTAAPETNKAPILDSPTMPAPAPSGNSGDSAGKDGLTYTYPPEKIGALFDTFLKDPTFTEAFGKPERDDAGACIGNAAQGKLSDQFIDVLERASKGDITAGNEIEDPKFMNDLLNFILIMDSCGVNITMQ